MTEQGVNEMAKAGLGVLSKRIIQLGLPYSTHGITYYHLPDLSCILASMVLKLKTYQKCTGILAHGWRDIAESFVPLTMVLNRGKPEETFRGCTVIVFCDRCHTLSQVSDLTSTRMFFSECSKKPPSLVNAVQMLGVPLKSKEALLFISEWMHKTLKSCWGMKVNPAMKPLWPMSQWTRKKLWKDKLKVVKSDMQSRKKNKPWASL